MFTDLTRRLRLDTLERRDVPTAGVAITSRLTAGILTINGTNGDDTITVSQTSTQIKVTVATVTTNFSAFSTRLVVVFGYNGSDSIDLSGLACPARVFGGWGQDTILGGRGHDLIYGEAEDDSIDGGPGNDLIIGGQGNDLLLGNFGNDEIFGDDANGAAFGGNDTIAGGRGFDWLYGEGGNDSLYADEGAAPFLGEFDFAIGGAGRDNFYNMPRFGTPGVFVSPILGNRAGRTGALDALTYESVVN
ncbi:MAG: calcium-binding protein [Gemmataceae bacterium]